LGQKIARTGIFNEQSKQNFYRPRIITESQIYYMRLNLLYESEQQISSRTLRRRIKSIDPDMQKFWTAGLDFYVDTRYAEYQGAVYLNQPVPYEAIADVKYAAGFQNGEWVYAS